MILGRHSGRAAVIHRLAAIGETRPETADAVLARLKTVPKGVVVDDAVLRDWVTEWDAGR